MFNDKIASPSKCVAEMSKMWDKIDALMDGTEGMREAGKKYLPQFPAESDDSYKYRLATSTLFNVFKKTVKSMAGKPFASKLSVSNADELPTDWLDNVDMEGNDLHAFAYRLFTQVVEYGICHVLVDNPVMPEGVKNLAQEKALGLRPYCVIVEPSKVLGWKYQTVSGAKMLTEVRIKESVEEDGDEIEQIRVLERGAWSTYRKAIDKSWMLHDQGTTTLSFIPMVTVYANSEEFMEAEPPLMDLADLNIKHWQSQSDQDTLLHIARVPLLVRTGVDNNEREGIKISASSIIDLPFGATLGYVEHSGAAIAAGADSLRALEEQMESMGADILLKRPGTMTATQSAIETAQSQSMLYAMVKNLENSLENMLIIMGTWRGIVCSPTVNAFKDFGRIDAADMATILQLHLNGIVSKQTVFSEAKRRNTLDADVDFETEQALILEGD